MADNYLITGYWGEPHVTVENDRGINAAIFGLGRFVLPVGERFRAEYIGNNTIRMYDGKLIDNGAAAGIPVGQYVDLLIPETGQGMKRNDLIVFQYSKNAQTLTESGTFVVVQGVESATTPTDPELTQEDILSDTASSDQMALWRVTVEGTIISAPVQVFTVAKNMAQIQHKAETATSSDGITYTATIDGVTELYNGLEITVIPTVANASTAPTLNVNGLGAYRIRRPISVNNLAYATNDPTVGSIGKNRPLKLIFDKNYAAGSVWRMVDRQQTSGSDIYGEVPVEKGGTGADNAADARTNLGITPKNIGAAETSHTHNKTDILDFPTSMTPTAHNQSADTITGGTFAGQVFAGANKQQASIMMIRNSNIVATETTPTNNGEISWTYE